MLLVAIVVAAPSLLASAPFARGAHAVGLARHSALICSDVVDATRGGAGATATEARLLELVRQDERDLRTLDSMLAELGPAAGEPPPRTNKKLIVGDWSLEYASDERAVAPFSTGLGTGPFAVVEGVVQRFRKSDSRCETLEVVRRFGPFGNAKSALCGRWSLGADGGSVRWRAQYAIDERGREQGVDGAAANEARIAHASKALLVLRMAAGGGGEAAGGLCIFSRLASLKRALNEWNVADEEVPT